jgi:NAD(P)-dependent dehydrogenase (short-subunit alcohol dehydrogenase family)
VTGGTNGIGYAIALELLREGAQVAVSGLPKDVEEGRQPSRPRGSAAHRGGDMSDEAFCRQLVAAVAKLRPARLPGEQRIFVHRQGARRDAGGFPVFVQGRSLRVRAHDPARGGADEARRCGGAIVNVSSISSWVAQPNRWTYNTAKGAVTQLTRCAALDLAPFNIRVNSISPGWIWTREVDKAAGGDREKFDPIWGQYHMLARMGHPVEMAGPALFLLSNDASFITGTELPVDGGYNGIGPEGLGQTSKIAGSR